MTSPPHPLHPDPIHVVEVGPRDGLQSVGAIVPSAAKVAFVDALSESGIPEIEVTSFVSPRWVPQLADADDVFRAIRRRPGVTYGALVPNERGLDRAVACGVDKIAVFTAASETFCKRNVNTSIAGSLQRFRPVLARSPVPVRGYVSTAFHCPYEGAVSPDAAVVVIRALLDLGCIEISVGDTTGRAAPDDVSRLLDLLLRHWPVSLLAMHFHDTFGHGVVNALAAERLGVRRFDASAGGIGGCPYAPGASGNVATEALVRAFPGRTGVDLGRLEDAAAAMRRHLASLPSPGPRS